MVDSVLIAALYEASKQGVKIDLIVRGICCLRPQVKGLSENIFVRSIIGRFLEHSRIYYFYNNGNEEIYLSSSDLMQRNLDRRVEVTFPIENDELKKNILTNVLYKFLEDNTKSRVLNSDGLYEKLSPFKGENELSVQEYLMKAESFNNLKKK